MHQLFRIGNDQTYPLVVLRSGYPCLLFIVLAAITGMTRDGVAQETTPPDGEALYMTRCASCHLPNGEGITGAFPPLNEVDWVTGDKGRLIRIVLDGVIGPIQVGNTVYTGAMPPWKTFLNDQEMAALLTYIRTTWDNDASEVTDTEVRLVREATSDRNEAWTAEELRRDVNQGIPEPFRYIFSPEDTVRSN